MAIRIRLLKVGIPEMNTIERSAAAILVGVLWVAGVAQAGELKGKVSAAGLKSAENIAVYIDTIPGQEIRSSRTTRCG